MASGPIDDGDDPIARYARLCEDLGEVAAEELTAEGPFDLPGAFDRDGDDGCRTVTACRHEHVADKPTLALKQRLEPFGLRQHRKSCAGWLREC